MVRAMGRSRAKGVALAAVGLLLLSNLLTAVLEIDGTAWFVLRLLLAGALAGALVSLALDSVLAERRRRTTR